MKLGLRNICLLIPTLLAANVIGGQAGPRSGYNSLDAIENDLIQLANDNIDNATMTKLADGAGVITTEARRNEDPKNIWCFKLEKGGEEPNRENVLILSNIHAREWITSHTSIKFAHFLLDHLNDTTWPANTPFVKYDYFRQFPRLTIKHLTDNANIFLVPVANPQGYAWSFEKDLMPQPPFRAGWRKNRRDVHEDPLPPVTEFSFHSGAIPGVDLNRNFPSANWGQTGIVPWTNNVPERIRTSRWRSDEVYCGRPTGGSWQGVGPFAPILEKETTAITTLLSSRFFRCFVDVHSAGGTIGWVEEGPNQIGSKNLRPGGELSDQEVFDLIAGRAAGLVTDPVSGNNYVKEKGPYPTSGDTTKWQYEASNKNCYAYLIEMAAAQNNAFIFRPENPDQHAEAVQPALFLMMFASIDNQFVSRPGIIFEDEP